MENQSIEGRRIARRQLLVSALFGGGLFLGFAALFWRFVQYVFPNVLPERIVRIPVGSRAELQSVTAKAISFGDLSAFVVNDNGVLRAFSRVCTHLGCVVHWNGKARRFHCPCHDAYFGPDGRVLSGPPPRPLVALPLAERDGLVYVRLVTRELYR